MTNQKYIRNFSIIAHIDHGKSTLADRMLEATGAISESDMREQVLDDMDLERERGITIKASAVRMQYTAKDLHTYELNLIDTPGHVDFSYEVSRALHACEGAVLLVDVSQGVEAQTVGNAYMALDEGLELIPVVTKIDLEKFDRAQAARQLQDDFGFASEQIHFTSGKTGAGVEKLFEAIVEQIPPPAGDPDAPLKALIFDSKFDLHLGVVAYIRVFDGTVRAGDHIQMMSTGQTFEVTGVGVFAPQMAKVDELGAGSVGYLTASMKQVADSRVGDTITSADRPATEPLPGYRKSQPMVFAGLYPVDNADHPALRDALDRYSLNDAAFVYEPETSAALGFGFRCGFLGLLHMDIVQERLEREYSLDLVATAPSVGYRILRTDGEIIEIHNPAALPEPQHVEQIEEPIVAAQITVPQSYVGACMKLSESVRGKFVDMEYIETDRVVLNYTLPLAEIIVDYYDNLKTVSRGYAMLDYEPAGYQVADLVKVDILVNGDPVDALAIITHRQFAERRGRTIIKNLKREIPRQLFEVRLQASIGKRVVAAMRIPPLRKDVIEKLYGGDVTRKRKLLEKQKAGKKRMKQVGQVEIPQEAFMAVLRTD